VIVSLQKIWTKPLISYGLVVQSLMKFLKPQNGSRLAVNGE